MFPAIGKALLSPSGRIGRLQYLGYIFGAWVSTGVAAAVLFPVVMRAPTFFAVVAGVALAIVCLLFVFSVGIVLPIKRFHDFDWSGWSILLSLIPLVDLIMLAIFFIPGTQGPNRFGPGRGTLAAQPAVPAIPSPIVK